MLEILSSYVPTLVKRRLANNPLPLTAPVAETITTAVFFADISGFTALTEHLVERNQEGVEDLSHLLNLYFGQLIDLITAHGGDIVKFAGDALLALWPVENTAPVNGTNAANGQSTAGSQSPTTLQIATRRAAQCALVIQNVLHNDEVLADVRLSMRIGIGAGQVSTMHLGGIQGRWELLLTGHPLVQVSLAENQAEPGQVVVSPEAWALVADEMAGQPLPGGTLLEPVREPLVPTAQTTITLDKTAEAALRAYIPGAIKTRLAAGHTGWLAELRRVTVLFLMLPGLNENVPLDQAQTIIHALQTALYRYEGSINKLNVDDKGVTLLAALGLPPLAHEDDAARGGQAALEMVSILKELGVACTVGVATGRAFCGSIGSNMRREYTMIGDVVNLAARLMQAAARFGSSESPAILCDVATYQASQTRLIFEPLPPITVKGKSRPVLVYQPVGVSQAGYRSQPVVDIVGRAAEQAVLGEALQKLMQGQSGVIVLEGEAGIGKSQLVNHLRRQAESRRVGTLTGGGDAIETASAYHGWRGVFSQLFDISLMTDPNLQWRHLSNLLEDEPDLLRLAPLLNPVLSFNLLDNELTAQMIGQARADNTRDLLIRLLQDSANRSPKVIILEDAHWLDSASWALVRAVSQRVHPILLVIAIRPLTGAPASMPAEYHQLLKMPGTKHLQLNALSLADTQTLVSRRLGGVTVPEAVLSLIHEKAEGHPFFSEELTYVLRDSGFITVANGECRVLPNVDLRLVSFPDTVEGVITSRIDRLTPPQQLTLKVASVIGRVFAFRLLRDIHPVEADKSQLAEYLSTLERLDLTLLDSPEPDLSYIFKHAITQEVAYNLMLFAQRRQLHRSVAEWYERTYGDDLRLFYPVLAYHWDKAEAVERAIYYLEKAGEEALRGNANQEAVGFLHKALALAGTPYGEGLRGARWQRLLGEAYLGLGDLTAGRTHLERALALLGRPLPTSRRRLWLNLARQGARQVLHRLWPGRFIGRLDQRSEAALEARLEAARAYGRLTEISFFTSDTLRTLHQALHGLNLAESIGPSLELARISGHMCVTSGLLSFNRLARVYAEQARAVAEQVEQLPAMAWALMSNALYLFGIGAWTACRQTMEQAIELWNRLGDQRYWEASSSILAMLIAYHDGDFGRSAALSNAIYESSLLSGNAQAQAWGLLGQAENLLRLDRVDEAFHYLTEAQKLVVKNIGRTEEIRIDGLLALAHWRRGEPDAARPLIEQAIALMDELSPTTHYSLEAYAAVCKVSLALWEASLPEPPATLVQLGRQATAALRRFARILPIARPRALVWQGVQYWLSGQPERARRVWQQGLVLAEKLEMPYEQGLALYELGRHATGLEQYQLLHRASAIFRRLGASYNLAQTEEALHSHTTPEPVA